MGIGGRLKLSKTVFLQLVIKSCNTCLILNIWVKCIKTTEDPGTENEHKALYCFHTTGIPGIITV